MERHAMSETADWRDELLVMTLRGATGQKTLGPQRAEEFLDALYPDRIAEHQVRKEAILRVARGEVETAEAPSTMGPQVWTVRRATRAEALGQEDRLHEDDEDRNLDGLAKEDLAEQLNQALDALAALMEWEAHMGGWDAPVWGRARDILAKHGRN